MLQRLQRDDRGLSKLEWLGVLSVAFGLAVFIPPFRGVMGDLYTDLIWESTLWRGLLIGIGSFVIFGGAVTLLIYTNLGTKLGFLVAGAGLFGSGTISGLLFVLYAPRGPRPADFEGLNAFQIRIIPGAMMIGSAVLFTMFLAALSRLEAADREEAEA